MPFTPSELPPGPESPGGTRPPRASLERVHPLPPSPAPPEPQRWQPSNLTLRLITAGALIPPLLWVIAVGGVPYVAVVIGIALIGLHEFYNFIAAKGATPHRLLGSAATALLPIVVYVGDPFWATSLMTAVLLAVMIVHLAKAEIREAIVSLSATFFGVIYVGWLLAHAVSVRFIHRELLLRYGDAARVIDPDAGVFFMILCLAAAIGSDTGAYIVGRAYGRRPLAPAISPNKTVEGALGGLAIGALLAAAAKLVFDYAIPGGLSSEFGLLAAFLFGIAIACAATLGDLVESLLKRDAHLKDAGHLLPGVGGVLDRIDSVLLAIPVTYYLLLGYYYLRLS